MGANGSAEWKEAVYYAPEIMTEIDRGLKSFFPEGVRLKVKKNCMIHFCGLCLSSFMANYSVFSAYLLKALRVFEVSRISLLHRFQSKSII